MEKNIERVMKKFNIETEEKLQEMLKLLPKEHRKVFEARWGIDEEGTYCNKLIILSQKLGIEDGAKRLYDESKTAFENIKFVSIFEPQEYDEWKFQLAVGYGMLVCTIFGSEEIPKMPFEQVQCICDEKINTLSEREIVIMASRFGLDGGTRLPLVEIAEIFKVSSERIRQINAKSLRTLRRSIKPSMEGARINDDTPTDQLMLTTRAHTNLKRARVKTFGQLKQMTREDLMKIRCMGDKTAKEILDLVQQLS